MTSAGRDAVGDYLLGEVLGKGSTGRVFLATHEVDGSMVAVKLLREEFADDPVIRARFVQEAEALRRLDHPAVVPVIEMVAEGPRLAIVVGLVSGPNLRQFLHDNGPMAPATACRLTAEICAGLAAAHAAGVVHRDLKPENVLLEDDAGRVRARVTDFGIARLSHGPALTRASQLVGTPDYIAPELISGRSATGAVDVYAIGVLLFEMIVGWRPFRGEHAAAILQQHLYAEVRPPSNMPAEVVRLIERCLQKDPVRRPAIGRLSRELAAAADDLADTPALPARPEPRPASVDPIRFAATELSLPAENGKRGRRRGRAANGSRSRSRWLVAAGITGVLAVGTVAAAAGPSLLSDRVPPVAGPDATTDRTAFTPKESSAAPSVASTLTQAPSSPPTSSSVQPSFAPPAAPRGEPQHVPPPPVRSSTDVVQAVLRSADPRAAYSSLISAERALFDYEMLPSKRAYSIAQSPHVDPDNLDSVRLPLGERCWDRRATATVTSASGRVLYEYWVDGYWCARVNGPVFTRAAEEIGGTAHADGWVHNGPAGESPLGSTTVDGVAILRGHLEFSLPAVGPGSFQGKVERICMRGYSDGQRTEACS